MTENSLHEISRRSIKVSKYEDSEMSWHNHVLTVRTGKGLHFYKYSYNLDCLDKRIDCIESTLVTPDYSPATFLFSKEFMSTINNLTLTHMMIDPAYWPHSPKIMQTLVRISSFQWSPVGFVPNERCAIAILNNVGGIEIFAHSRNKWNSLLNLSKLTKKIFSKSLDLSPNNVANLDTVKKTVETLETSAICWAPTLNEDTSCYFIASQKNSNMLIWKLKNEDQEIKAELHTAFSVTIDEVIAMIWIPKTENIFFIICSTVNGQVFALRFNIDEGKDPFKTDVLYVLWKDKDMMISNHVDYEIVKSYTAIIFNKHRHLIVQIIDKECNVLQKYVHNINDNKIISIKKNKKSEFFVSTSNYKIYKVCVIFTNNILNVNIDEIELKLSNNVQNHEMLSFCWSDNFVLSAVTSIDKRVFHRKEVLYVDLIFMTPHIEHAPVISFLLNNPTKSIHNAYDAVEFLRYRVMKLKCLPEIDFNKLYVESDKDLYKLRLYLVLLKLYDVLEKILKNGSKGLLPETSVEYIKEKILEINARNLLNKQINQNEDVVNMKSVIGASKYLKYYSEKYKVNLGINEEHLKFEVKEICEYCHEKVTYYRCKNNHVNNMYCAITFAPIENDNYLICQSCNVTAAVELFPHKPLCIFCDTPLDINSLPS